MAGTPSFKASQLDIYSLSTSDSPSKATAPMQHRLDLIAFWGIQPGSRVLEIGCGQGDCTVVLAEAVGEGGHVDAVDPGAPDYGAPVTLSQAQSYILASPLGPRILFHNATPEAYLAAYTGPAYDYIVLSHCIYYFSTPAVFPVMLKAMAPHCRNLCIAEWALHASGPANYPHVLTTLLLSLLESKRGEESSGNIRTVLSPAQITKAVLATPSSGADDKAFKLAKEVIRPTNEGMQDGFWEVSDVSTKREREVALLRSNGVSEAEVTAVEAMYDAVEQGVVGLEGGIKGVRAMDHWVGLFGRV